MLRSVMTVGGWTMASRILGFARDMLIASRLGAGPVADAFFVALKLPNLFRRLFGEGAFNAAFVPAFAGTLATEGRDAARALAERMGAIMGIWLGTLVVLGMIAWRRGRRRGGAALLVLTLAQPAVGLLMAGSGLPLVPALLHNLLAAMLLATLVRLI